MAKIGKGRFHWEQSYGDYEIMYSAKNKEFYTDVSKLFAGAGEFFDSLFQNDKKTEGISMEKPSWGRDVGKRKIVAPTEKELVNSVNLFNRLFVETVTSEVKVILYQFTYSTETIRRDGYDNFSHGNSESFGMEFKYHIADKKILGDNKLYTDAKTKNRIDKYDSRNFKEIPWSQELEDFIKSFSKSFDDLVNNMKPFFEVDGKIIELIGKNILMP